MRNYLSKMYCVYLKKNEEKRVLNGYPWIFANEVYKIDGKDKQGSVAEVRGFDGRFVGLGTINHHSKIIVRMLTLKKEEIDEDFYRRRILAAVEYRKELGYDNNYRAVFAESDLLPGLIVDKYGDYLSVQFLSLGMEVVRETIIKLLVGIFNPKGIYERSDVPVREKEGLEQRKGVIYGEFEPRVTIIENGLKMVVDFENGQKTGYFLDQKENRDNLKCYVKGKTVLDCFCNEGGFSLCAKKYGATEVTAVDISEKAIELVKENAALNGIGKDRLTVRQGDATKEGPLRDAIGTGYDVVVANIVADVIISLAPQVRHFLKEDGWFLTSGIIDDRADEVAAALVAAGWSIVESCTSEGWYCYICR